MLQNKVSAKKQAKKFAGTIQPMTCLDEPAGFHFKLVLPNGHEYYLLTENAHRLQFQMDVWEEFQIEGFLLSKKVIAVKTSKAMNRFLDDSFAPSF